MNEQCEVVRGWRWCKQRVVHHLRWMVLFPLLVGAGVVAIVLLGIGHTEMLDAVVVFAGELLRVVKEEA